MSNAIKYKVEVGICGSSGRNGKMDWFVPENFVATVEDFQREILSPGVSRVSGVSGGSTGIDHVAVVCFQAGTFKFNPGSPLCF